MDWTKWYCGSDFVLIYFYFIFIFVNKTDVFVTSLPFSCLPFEILKTCLFEELFDKRSLKDFASWFIICCGWFHDVFKGSNWSFGFLYGLYITSDKTNVTYKKPTMCKFVFISVLKPEILKICIRPVFCFDVFL